jgi:hypothetical protein
MRYWFHDLFKPGQSGMVGEMFRNLDFDNQYRPVRRPPVKAILPISNPLFGSVSEKPGGNARTLRDVGLEFRTAQEEKRRKKAAMLREVAKEAAAERRKEQREQRAKDKEAERKAAEFTYALHEIEAMVAPWRKEWMALRSKSIPLKLWHKVAFAIVRRAFKEMAPTYEDLTPGLWEQPDADGALKVGWKNFLLFRLGVEHPNGWREIYLAR